MYTVITLVYLDYEISDAWIEDVELFHDEDKAYQRACSILLTWMQNGNAERNLPEMDKEDRSWKEFFDFISEVRETYFEISQFITKSGTYVKVYELAPH